MFNFRRDDVIALLLAALKNAPEGSVIRFSSAGSEYYLFRLGAQKLGYRAARFIHNGPRFLPEKMYRTGISVILTETWKHGFQDALVHLSRRTVIEIDSLLHHALEYHIIHCYRVRLC